MTAAGPTHLVAEPGDRRSICGIKNPLPVCWVQSAPKHGYPHARCPVCFENAGLGHLLAPGEAYCPDCDTYGDLFGCRTATR